MYFYFLLFILFCIVGIFKLWIIFGFPYKTLPQRNTSLLSYQDSGIFIYNVKKKKLSHGYKKEWFQNGYN